MRRLFLIGFLALTCCSTQADELYFSKASTTDRNIYAVSATGGQPRVVLSGSEYTGAKPNRITNQDHPGSNGQALIRAVDTNNADIELVYRATDRRVVVKRITSLSSNPFKPFYKPDVAKDDSFFSFRCKDGQGNFALYRLNVSVDEALAPNYVPPTSYDDPRMELVYTAYLNPATGRINPLDCSWSGDGARVVFHDLWQAADGKLKESYRVRNMIDGSLVTLYETDFGAAPTTPFVGLEWSPTSDQILQQASDGQGIFVLYADSPGVLTWAIQKRTYKIKRVTITDEPSWGLWWRNGQGYAFALKRGKSSSTEYYPASTDDGWATASTLTPNQSVSILPFGWTP